MERPSKTARKQEALSAQELGDKLVTLSAEQLAKVPLPEEIRKEVALARTITKHGGKKRQLQYIGALMRKVDTAPIREAVTALEEGDRRQVELHKLSQHWRDELVGGNDGLLGELALKMPEDERQQFQDLVTKARNERTKPAPSPSSSRMLFRFLFLRAAVLKK